MPLPQNVVTLIGGQKAEFNHASRLRTWVLRTQSGIALLAAATIPISSPFALYVFSIVALALAGLWFLLWHRLSASRAHAERLRRTTLLVGGLGFELSGADLIELMRDGKASPAEAARLIDPDYFATAREPSVGKLVDMLEESAIWTANLAKIAAGEAWAFFIAVFVLMLAALFVSAVVTSPSEWQLGARIIMTVLASLLSADFLGAAFGYESGRAAAKRTVDLLQKHKLEAPQLAPVMLILGDYNSAVEAMPTFSNGLYPRHEKTLNEQYKMFLTGPQ